MLILPKILINKVKGILLQVRREEQRRQDRMVHMEVILQLQPPRQLQLEDMVGDMLEAILEDMVGDMVGDIVQGINFRMIDC